MFTDLNLPVAHHFLGNIPTPALGDNNYSRTTRRNDHPWIVLVLVLLAHLTALVDLRPQPQDLLPEALPEPIVVSLLSEPQATPQNSGLPSHPKQKMQRMAKPKAIEKKPTKKLARQSQNASRMSVEQESPPVAQINSQPNATSEVSKISKPPTETNYQQPSFNAAYLHNPEPAYPPVSKRLGEQGRVLLLVMVSADGTANSVSLQASSGSTRLDQAALESVKKWRFVPAKRGGQAISASVVVPVRFSIEG